MPNTTVQLGDIVKVVNHGNRPIKLKWDSREYPIAPRTEEFVPFEAAKLYFGDPRSTKNVQSVRDDRGVVGFVSDRATEVRRLRLLWDHKFGEYIPGEVNAFQSELIPRVEVFDLKGNKISTVLEDPEGNDISPSTQTQREANDTMSVIKRQGELIEILMQRLGMGPAALNGADMPPVEPLPLTDEPDAQPVFGHVSPPPDMVYNARTEEITETQPKPPEDPDELEDLPTVED